MEINEILRKAVQVNASDIFIVAGFPLTFKVDGKIIHEESGQMDSDDTASLVQSIYDLASHRDIHPALKNRRR